MERQALWLFRFPGYCTEARARPGVGSSLLLREAAWEGSNQDGRRWSAQHRAGLGRVAGTCEGSGALVWLDTFSYTPVFFLSFFKLEAAKGLLSIDQGRKLWGGLRPSALKPTLSAELWAEAASVLGAEGPRSGLACGFRGQPAAEGACGSWFLVGQAVRVGCVGRAVFWAHVCVKAHVSVNVCCVNTCAWEHTRAEPKFKQDCLVQYFKALVYSYRGPYAELNRSGWQASNAH